MGALGSNNERRLGILDAREIRGGVICRLAFSLSDL